jgi:ABC-type transport system involved in multi-copper enzyme maturation permease subunit
MLIYIVLRELRHSILSLRLHIALLLIFVVFSVGTVAFVMNHRAGREEHRRYRSELSGELRERAESNLSQLAVESQDFILKPRGNAFIDDSKEKYLPTSFEYSAYNVFGFEVRPGSMNPYLQSFQELNWMFIVSIIIGFTVFLFTFDTISGEKESRTLAISLANPVSRGTLLFGKYLSTIITTLFVLVPGMCVSLVIILVSGTVAVSLTTILEIAGFLLAVAVFVACITAFGMVSSVVTRSANVSLLIALTLWLVFVAIVPNTALFWAQTLFPIEKAEIVAERITSTREEINRNAPEGSWAASSNNPFLPDHELRAANQTNLMKAEKRIRDAWYLDMFRQLERVRLVTLLSPVSLFEYMCEAVVGGGYVRFQKNWNDLHIYQERFLSFFKEKDANDPESPHWYNPIEDYSTTRKPVNFEELPLYTEKTISFGERFSCASKYLLLIAVYAAVVFFATFVLFVRYDVR